LNFVHFANVAIKVARKEGCNASAANDAPATTMLTACAIVTITVCTKNDEKNESESTADQRIGDFAMLQQSVFSLHDPYRATEARNSSVPFPKRAKNTLVFDPY
jgi:hypothetical protein